MTVIAERTTLLSERDRKERVIAVTRRSDSYRSVTAMLWTDLEPGAEQIRHGYAVD